MPPHDVYIESHLGGGAIMRHKRPAKVNIGIDIDRCVIERWQSSYPDICTLVNGDATEYLSRYKFGGNELVYCDPPYVPALRRRRRVYRFDLCSQQHTDLIQVIRSIPCNVMISGYAGDLYERLLSDWRRVAFQAKTHAGVREESVWINFDIPSHLHDPRHFGDTFRCRQTFRRRRQRIIAKFAQMAPQERSIIIAELVSEFGRTKAST